MHKLQHRDRNKMQSGALSTHKAPHHLGSYSLVWGKPHPPTQTHTTHTRTDTNTHTHPKSPACRVAFFHWESVCWGVSTEAPTPPESHRFPGRSHTMLEHLEADKAYWYTQEVTAISLIVSSNSRLIPGIPCTPGRVRGPSQGSQHDHRGREECVKKSQEGI